MENIIRDFKSFTSRCLKEEIQNNPQESRKKWLVWMMRQAGIKNYNNNEWSRGFKRIPGGSLFQIRGSKIGVFWLLKPVYKYQL